MTTRLAIIVMLMTGFYGCGTNEPAPEATGAPSATEEPGGNGPQARVVGQVHR